MQEGPRTEANYICMVSQDHISYLKGLISSRACSIDKVMHQIQQHFCCYKPLTAVDIHISIPTDAVAFTNAHFGAGAGPIYLDGVDCTGNEDNLTDCPSSAIFSCPSRHREDAGVRCQSKLA